LLLLFVEFIVVPFNELLEVVLLEVVLLEIVLLLLFVTLASNLIIVPAVLLVILMRYIF
jgi:hypothetical protein